MGKTVELDSLIANEFACEINGESLTGIFGVSNLRTLVTDDSGQRIKPPFEVSKMVQRDGKNAFNTWLRETMAVRNGGEKPRRDFTVLAVDDGVVTRRWTAKGAWIKEVRYSDFDSASFEMVSEVYTIAYEDIEEVFPTLK
jgi:hypothetical protein